MYIHELENWPRFIWQDQAIAAALAGVRHRQGRLLGRMESLGFALREQAVLQALTEEVTTSSQIEGEVLNKDQVRSSLARHMGLEFAGLPVPERHVEGIVEMMLDATRQFREPLTAERLFGWHAGLFPTGHSGISKITVGAWRGEQSGAMQVVSGPMGRRRVHFEAPPAARVPAEMERLLEWFNRRGSQEQTDGGDLVLRAAIAHLWLVTVHPFEDGNGRIARAITDMLLARSENSSQCFHSMSAQILAEREGYYRALELTQKGGLDITPWLQWFLGCLDRALESAQTMLGGVLQKARFWERHAGSSFNERQRRVLGRLLDGFEGKLTSSKWAKLAKCSQDTALRDIEGLVEFGILRRNGPGGRSTSYSLEAMESL